MCACLHENLLIRTTLITQLCPGARLGMNFRKRDVCFARAPTSHILAVPRKSPRISALRAPVPAAAGGKAGSGHGAHGTPCALSVPRHGKPDQHQAQGLSPAPAPAEGVQLLPEQRKGLGFTGCVIRDRAPCLGESGEPRPGSAIPFCP